MARSAFEPAGAVFATTAFCHVTFKVNLTHYDDFCATARVLVERARDAGAASDADLRVLRMEVDEACVGLFTWTEASPTARPRRQKRQVLAALAAVGAAAGTLFGAYSITEMRRLGAEVEQLHQDQQKGLHVLHEQQLRVGALEDDVRAINGSLRIFLEAYKEDREHTMSKEVRDAIVGHVKDFAMKSRAVQRGMQALHMHRLSVDLVTTEQAGRIWPAVLDKVQRGEHLFPFQHSTALYQLPTSFVVEQGIVRVFVHVPIIKRRLDFYRHRSTPIVVQEDGHAVVLELTSDEADSMLAVDRDHTVFAVMGPPEMDECLQVGKAFFCRMDVLRRDFARSCLGALFVNDNDGILRHCETRLSDRSSFAFRIGNETHVYSEEPVSITASCTNGSRWVHKLVGHSRLHVSEGCQLTADPFLIDGEEKDLLVDGGSIVYRLEAPVSVWCAGASVKRIREAQRMLQDVGLRPDKTVRGVLQQLEQHERRRGHHEVHQWQHLGMGMLAGALVTVAGLGLWYLLVQRRWRRGLFGDLQSHVAVALEELGGAKDEEVNENNPDSEK